MVGKPSPSPFTTTRLLQVLAGETTGPVPEDRERLTLISIAGGKASLATLPLGVEATVDADAQVLTIDEPALLVA